LILKKLQWKFNPCNVFKIARRVEKSVGWAPGTKLQTRFKDNGSGLCQSKQARAGGIIPVHA